MGYGHTGSEDALPVWLNSMTELHQDLPKLPFPTPEGVASRTICNYSGKVAGQFCNLVTSCLYISGHATAEQCDGNHFEHPKENEATMFNNFSPASQGNKVRQVF
jgi:penicillin-binding protein 1A